MFLVERSACSIPHDIALQVNLGQRCPKGVVLDTDYISCREIVATLIIVMVLSHDINNSLKQSFTFLAKNVYKSLEPEFLV